jgi:hypothetical protein
MSTASGWAAAGTLAGAPAAPAATRAALVQRRVILLGASNLSRGLAIAVDEARAALAAPLELLAAPGRGRSYKLESRFLGRVLPGILDSGLWTALEEAPPRPTWALLTDVGNDLAFGVESARILEWVGESLDRVERARGRAVESDPPGERGRTAITTLPLFNFEGLAPWKFAFWSRLFFPGRGLERERLLERARELDAGLRELARTRGLALVEARPEWYGADPIHVKLARRRDAWRGAFRAWGDGPAVPGSGGLLGLTGLESQLLPPQRRRLLGLERVHRQPCRRLRDGTSLALY